MSYGIKRCCLARSLLLSCAVGLLAACSNSSAPIPPQSPQTVAADFPGITNPVPPSLAEGTSRPGTFYDVYLVSPVDGEKIAITVYEPAMLTGGQKYPLLLNSHGWGGSRARTADPWAQRYIDAGYGVITIDERGWGEAGGAIRGMDPDFEGRDLISVIDWAEARLDWLLYGPSVDGRDPNNLMLGTYGGSYGGMFQYLIHNIDPKRRLDVITPSIAPNSLRTALFPGGVPKSIQNPALVATGSLLGRLDPYTREALSARRLTPEYTDFLDYHSNRYFCDTRTVATNGGAGTAPRHPPRSNGKVHALILQGVRDTLFNMSEGFNNYTCLKALGGDVRFFTTQWGHNAEAPIVPDLGNRLYFPNYMGGARPGNEFDTRCGRFEYADLEMAYFERYLKGNANAMDGIPTGPCLSLASGDAVTVDSVTTGSSRDATVVDIPATTVVSGAGLLPVAVDLGIVGAPESSVVAGIPRLRVKVTSMQGAIPGDSVIFVGLGQSRGVPGVWDLLNNQVQPLLGVGDFDVDLVGVSARLAAGERLALLIYGLHEQFATAGSVTNPVPLITPITVEGKLSVPLLEPGSYQVVTQ